MNDEPLIRLRARKSKHGPNENPRKYTGILDGFHIGDNQAYAY